ncbi:sodium-independent sulfate anion transporter [Eupeodes corollae]|uniref:sodium-independent sulfate anion transporter n=1 Tax=Eupeodes corollae TaxID=290404 RepID=UPI002491F11B|nr:sodium-independent sulfate anion transporter [Eupeodes corollae]XP_055912235.1 sodium-independent sulfate anion transporter [Eupeodes corollae]
MTVVNIISKFVPGIKWLNGYSVQFAISDMIAGITVGLTVLPQGLAYATLAGLEPQYGLYSAFVGGILYALMGGCCQVTIGPTALLALITSKHTGLGLASGPTYAILLCFISGIIELLMALLRLGALVDLISLPVTVGFTSATAVIIGTSQLKGLLGLKGGSGSDFINTIKSVFTNLDMVRPGDMTLGFISIVLLLLMRKLKDIKLSERVSGHKLFNGIFWLLATARNALIVLISSTLAYYTCQGESCIFVLTGKVKGGLPDFSLPSFNTTILSENNTAIEQNFTEMMNELGSSIIILPVIAVLGNVAISKAFGGSGISATRELVALSLSNICGSFFSSIPVTGSFSRSAVNHASGVKTPIGGIYTSALVLLALAVLTPYFRYIPKAALSAVIISAVIFMIEFEVVRPLWRCSRRELFPGAITFIFSLTLGVEVGLLLGVATDVAFLVYRVARPPLGVTKAKTRNGIEHILVRPSYSSVYFPAIEWLRNEISKAISSFGIYPVVLDCTNIYDFDFTAARGMGALYKELLGIKVPFYLLKASKEIDLILKESTDQNIPSIENVEELESLLEQSPEYEYYLQVTVPLVPDVEEHDKVN